jgi:hypothetical protein
MNLKSLALQRAHQFRSLVCGNSARDAHRDSHGSIVAGFALENRDGITSREFSITIAWSQEGYFSQLYLLRVPSA